MKFIIIIIAGVPGEKPEVTSDKLPDSPSKFPCIQLWMTRRIWHCIKSHLRPYSTHPFNYYDLTCFTNNNIIGKMKAKVIMAVLFIIDIKL